MPDPKPSVLKKLFALSRNVCAYRGCEERMADPKWPSVQGRVAHIRGDRPGSARYDSSMTDEQRRAFENLILLCPNDHALIDELERDAHPPELLEQMKQEHERRTMESDAYQWCSEGELTKYANMLLVAQFGQVVTEEPQDHEQARAEAEANEGAGTAYDATAEPATVAMPATFPQPGTDTQDDEQVGQRGIARPASGGPV